MTYNPRQPRDPGGEGGGQWISGGGGGGGSSGAASAAAITQKVERLNPGEATTIEGHRVRRVDPSTVTTGRAGTPDIVGGFSVTDPDKTGHRFRTAGEVGAHIAKNRQEAERAHNKTVADLMSRR